MRSLSKIIAMTAAAFVVAGCTTSFYTSATSSAYDDMYVAHSRTAIAQKQQAEAEARRAEAEARRAEAEALRAQYEAEIARLGGSTSEGAKQRVDDDGLIIVDEGTPTYQSFVADDYESAYARRLLGFKSASYRMPSSYFNLRYGGSYTYVTAYDPAFYNIMVSGDQVWVEPRYITSMFGTWGATNATAMLYSPWYYGWGGWHSYDPWYYSWYGYPRYSWYDWNWNICYGGGWGVNLWWGWGGYYHPWRPYHHHYYPHYTHHHHIGGIGPGGWWRGNGYGTRRGAPRVVGNTKPAVKPQGQTQSRPQGTPSRTGSVVNRGSTVQTPYRSPITGSTYGNTSRGESGTATNTTQRTTGSVRRGSTTSGGSAVTTGSATSSSRSGSVRPMSGSSSSASSRSRVSTTTSRSTSSSYNSSSSSSRSYSSGSSSSRSSYSGSSSRSGSSGGSSRGGR